MLEYIPAYWKVVSMKRVIVRRDGGAWGEEPCNSVNDRVCMRVADFDFENGIFRRRENYTIRSYSDLQINQLSLKYGDILVEKSGGGEKTPVGRAVMFDLDCSALFANFMDRLRINESFVIPKFFEYYWMSMYFSGDTKRYIKQTTGIQNLDILILLSRELIPVPPLAEQEAIVKFLDYEVSHIEKLIIIRQRQIVNLNELKKAVINKAVTKGLKPNVKMKDSGVKWLGEIAEHAEIIKLKNFSYIKGRIGWQGLNSNDFIDEGPYCVTGTDFKNGRVNWSSCYHVSEERYFMDSKIHIQNGDLLVTKDGTIGKLAIIDNLPYKACLNSHLLIIRPINNKYINKFLFYVMQSSLFTNYYELVSTGAIMNSLSQAKTENFIFPIFSLSEQNEIAEYLDKKCSQIDRAIANARQQISELNELKARLISDVVTGKINVC